MLSARRGSLFPEISIVTKSVVKLRPRRAKLIALAMARIAANLKDPYLPFIGNVKKGNSKGLDHTSGVIGVVNNSKEKAGWKDSTSIEPSETTRRLQYNNPFTDLVQSYNKVCWALARVRSLQEAIDRRKI